MAVILSHTERSLRIENLMEQLASALDISRSAKDLVERMAEEGNAASAIETAVASLLTPLDTLTGNIGTALGALPVVHQPVVKIGMPHNYTYAVIKANDPAYNNYGTIRVAPAYETYVNPFSAFLAGDDLTLSEAENILNNSTYRLAITPATAGGEKLVNTDFSSNWTTTDWTVTNGVADHNTGNTSSLSQAYGAMSGVADNTYYILSFTISGWTAGTLTVRFDTGGQTRVLSAAANGDYEALVYSDSGGSLLFTPSTDFDGAVSAPSMIPWTGLAFSGALGADDTKDEHLVITLSER